SGTTSDHLPVSLRFDIVDPLEVSLVSSAQQVYNGYEPLETATLTAIVVGGAEAYNYYWSTGETTSEITVAPDMNTVYSVTVTDASGQTRTEEVTIEVINVNCGRNDEKVQVCVRGHTLCVAPFAVAPLLKHGASLGSCEEGELPLIESVCVTPNPFVYDFNMKVEANGEFEMQVVMKNFFGKEVLNEIVTVPAGESVHNFVPQNAPKGFYIIQLVNATTGYVEKTERVFKRR
ncbi:MAG: hypothetical protein RIB63_11380, partial [Fulvivirga sp.]